MTITESIVLGMVQGLTEFLPVSSDGHLALFQAFLGINDNFLTFDIVVHGATLLAVLIFFRNNIVLLAQQTIKALYLRKLNEVPLVVWYIGLGTLPAVLFGVFIKSSLESLYTSFTAVGLGFLVTATFLLIANRVTHLYKDLNSLSWKDSLLIGIGQALAILPGVSRSGLTVSTGLFRNINRESAFTFSFLLAIPAIMGATLLDIGNISTINRSDLTLYLLGFVTAFVSGYIALTIFKRLVTQNKLSWFGYYTLILGIVTLLVFSRI